MWYIGQRIVAVRDHNDKKNFFKKGDVFKIRALNTGCCCVNVDVGFDYPKYYSECGKCGKRTLEYGPVWFDENNFAPIQSFGEEVIERISKEIEIEYTQPKVKTS